MSRLQSPLRLRGRTLRNRVWVSPMCQYSSVDGHPTPWHLVHLGALARGGAGLVVAEATAVTPAGRISPADAGLWADDQVADYEPIVSFVHDQGAAIGVQLAHAGRKASTAVPWQGRGYVSPADGGWRAVAPSALAFDDLPTPSALTIAQIDSIVGAFAAAARRARDAGYDVVEIHAAHGYLLHQFLSPLSNHREDIYGRTFEGRTRLLVRVVDAVRERWPDDRPLFVRVSATDWVEAGWTTEQTVALARQIALHGVDLVDVSSGGLDPAQRIPVAPGFQVPLAHAVRVGAGVATSAVGLITEPAQAEQVLVDGSADAVMLGRALLRDPHWPLRAAEALDGRAPWPAPYRRARRTRAATEPEGPRR
jgi:2,4-dienoyl-CoA reductase-like NADH-dependent reductase (Old Yellow Enzyme family)